MPIVGTVLMALNIYSMIDGDGAIAIYRLTRKSVQKFRRWMTRHDYWLLCHGARAETTPKLLKFGNVLYRLLYSWQLTCHRRAAAAILEPWNQFTLQFTFPISIFNSPKNSVDVLCVSDFYILCNCVMQFEFNLVLCDLN